LFEPSLFNYALLAVAAFIAGAMNAVAGGGSFVSFPALVFTGVPTIVANASSTVALFPSAFASAWAYRENFRKFEGVSTKLLLVVSLAGGATGAILLLTTSQRTFDIIIPWLLLFASLTFAFGPYLAPRLRRVVTITPTIFVVLHFIVSIYGGYFGGAVGIVSMALWSLLGHNDIHEMNAAKTLLVGTMNTAAVVCFVIAGKIAWEPTLVMLVGALAGGYLGASVVRRMDKNHVRAGVIAISFVVTAAFFLKG
jgi:uncharacterized membrane protein YfcA